MEKVEVQEYGLFQFMVKVQELYEQGYRLNFEKNEDVPMSYGTLFVANMYKQKVVPVVTTVVEHVAEVVKEPVVETETPDVTPTDVPTETSTVARKTAKARAE